MEREEIFSKLTIKDYNNELEKILEKKSFSEDAKNFLITMLYQVEVAYNDYAKVKNFYFSKKQLMEEIINIIDKDCNSIEIIKPSIDNETILKDKKYLIDKEKKKIYAYPNANILIFALYVLSKKKFNVKRDYEILKEPIEKMLNIGWQTDRSEIIRDFDGWNWSMAKENIDNITYNLIYQNLCILLDNEFIEEQLTTKQDLIKNIETKFVSKYGEKLGKDLYTLIYKISILEYLKNDNSKIQLMYKSKIIIQEELKNMENKKHYLKDLAESKKTIGKKIREIDTLLNNNELLKEEFIKRNEKLDEESRIFSISNFVENLQLERARLMKELELYSELMKPTNYVKTKAELEYKIELLESVKETTNDLQEDINTYQIELQKKFLKAKIEDIEMANTKKEILELIYKFRYYKLLPIFNEQIRDVKELNHLINIVEKILITKACNLKVMHIMCNNTTQNSKFVSTILESKIIDLEKISIELKKKQDKMFINIYDDNIIDNTIEYKENCDLSIRANKKIKMFF